MADLSVTPVASQIKPVPNMSLADMVNLARGAQEYQQAIQINPIQLQAAQQQLQQAQQLNPIQLQAAQQQLQQALQLNPIQLQQAQQQLQLSQQSYGQAERMNPLLFQSQQQLTRKGEIELGISEEQDKERQRVMKLLADPSKFTTNNRLNLDILTPEIMKIAPLTGPAVLQGLTTLTQAQNNADAAESSLTQSDRELIAQPLAVLGYQGVRDPQAYAKVIRETQEANKNNPRLVSLGDSYLTQLQFADPAKLPDIAIRASQNLLAPTETKVLAPSIQTTSTGQTVTTQPAVGAAQPTATMGVVGGLQTAAPSAPAVNVPAGTTVAPGMRIPYQVRRADQPFIPEPSEKADLDAGQAYRTRLVTAQTGLAQNRRNTEEVINQANEIANKLFFEKGGIPGQIEHKIRMAISSEQYDMLAKDLANMALSNTQAMGGVGNTVAGLDMQQVANGTIKVPPDVLVKIARRVQADQTNLDMQANGAQAFSQRFGDNNMKAYQQAWNANADTKIFEAMNIVKDIQDPAKREAELNRLFPRASQRADFLTKYRNLKKLSETGSL